MKVYRFSYAVSVQPRNGQILNEFPDGLDADGFRLWADRDRKAFPQAERQCGATDCLVTGNPGKDRNVYRVDLTEALFLTEATAPE